MISIDFHGFPWISLIFPMDVRSISMDFHGFCFDFPWIPMDFHGFPIDFHGFLMEFLLISMSFPWIPWICMDFHRFQTALLYSVGLLGLDRLGSARHCFDRLGFETTRTTFRGGASHSTRATMENFKKSRQLGNSFLARAGESESLIIIISS